MKTIGIIPARAGSKSILHKNTVDLGGKPLIEWCMDAAQHSETLDYIICSTDDPVVEEICKRKKMETIPRPWHLAQGDRPIHEIMFNVLSKINEEFDIAALIQPTSPFITRETINIAVGFLKQNPGYNSIQTFTDFSHNYHAWNQRRFDQERIEFVFKKEREGAYNKQKKPEYYIFGNFVATRISALNEGVFAEPSRGFYVPRQRAIDIDDKHDLRYAEYLISIGAI